MVFAISDIGMKPSDFFSFFIVRIQNIIKRDAIFNSAIKQCQRPFRFPQFRSNFFPTFLVLYLLRMAMAQTVLG